MKGLGEFIGYILITIGIIFFILCIPLLLLVAPIFIFQFIGIIIKSYFTSNETKIKERLETLDKKFNIDIERFKKKKLAIKYLRIKKKDGLLTDMEEIDTLNFLESVYSNRLRNEYLDKKEWLLEDLKKEQDIKKEKKNE